MAVVVQVLLSASLLGSLLYRDSNLLVFYSGTKNTPVAAQQMIEVPPIEIVEFALYILAVAVLV